MKWIINRLIKLFGSRGVSDGYHTFDELYKHRIWLFIALCHHYPDRAWKSWQHADGSRWQGWFIAGIDDEWGKQITYHLPFDHFDYLKVKTLPHAPNFDGHTPDQVLCRLMGLSEARHD